MSDLISRHAAIDAYGDWYVEEGTAEGFIGTVKQLLEDLPSAQPERKTGKWEYSMNGYYKCSACGIETLIPDNGSAYVDDSESYHYCRWCGADMRGETE